MELNQSEWLSLYHSWLLHLLSVWCVLKNVNFPFSMWLFPWQKFINLKILEIKSILTFITGLHNKAMTVFRPYLACGQAKNQSLSCSKVYAANPLPLSFETIHSPIPVSTAFHHINGIVCTRSVTFITCFAHFKGVPLEPHPVHLYDTPASILQTLQLHDLPHHPFS